MKKTVSSCAVLAALVLASVAAFAGGEFGVLGGATYADKDFDGSDSVFGPTLGLKWAHDTSERMNWFVDGTFTSLDVDEPAQDTDLWAIRTGPEFFLSPANSRARWFIAPAAGWQSLNRDGDAHSSRGLVSLGLGQKIATGDNDNFNWQLRATQSLGASGYAGEGLLNFEALLGYAWGYGGAPKDEDGDGVSDRKDKCPGTPAGARVDEKGCPSDADGDGVFDGLDKCPDTPKGYPVDGSGCPLDGDGDGVVDGADKCPDTPKGATVDATGCPKDSDGDGVYDGLDKCPDTPKGYPVDATGCPLDSDRDGVVDGLDKCPGTPQGTKVDPTGCPLPEPKPQPAVAVGAALVLEGVNFDTGKATLTPDSQATLDKVVEGLKKFPEVEARVVGHTDDVGDAGANLKLSKDRAKSVREYLIAAGIAPERLTSEGFGEEKPVADNTTPEGRAKNRRVELERTK